VIATTNLASCRRRRLSCSSSKLGYRLREGRWTEDNFLMSIAASN
jgi:hypothetical protein